MPPSVTQILQSHISTDSVKCSLRSKEKTDNCTNTHTDTNTLCVYDVSLSRIPQPKFLKPVREWEKRVGFVTPIRWVNTIMITLMHLITLIWVLKCIYYFQGIAKWQTIIFSFFTGQLAGFGVTAGVHRYWCHRSYKARWPLKIILIVAYSVAGQNTIYEWVRDHRVHHKFSETTADPHDANRGFFFSHVGWLMMKKHPDVIREGMKMDMSDIANDPFVKLHTKYFIFFKVLCCWVVPSLIPWLCWSEKGDVSFISQSLVRYMISLHFTWSVNSFAHLWGNKPYDKHIMPAENLGVSIVSMGEGWHNYHHTFPWDYKAAELGVSYNITTAILNLFAKIGWAYDLKEASPALVRAVADKRGDHSR